MGFFDIFGGDDKEERMRKAQPEAIKAVRQFLSDVGIDSTDQTAVAKRFVNDRISRELVHGFLKGHADEYNVGWSADRLIRRVLHEFMEPHEVDSCVRLMNGDVATSKKLGESSRWYKFGLQAAKAHKNFDARLSNYYPNY